MLDAMENNSKGNDNFATKVISTKNVEKKGSSLEKDGRSKKKESNFQKSAKNVHIIFMIDVFSSLSI